MFSKIELLDAIDEMEEAPSTYQNCEKLATFYSLYDHLYGDKRPMLETVRQTVVDSFGDSDFFKAVDGADAEKVFRVLNELMETVRLLQPKLYEATLTELRDL
jgi:hypothetical protein